MFHICEQDFIPLLHFYYDPSPFENKDFMRMMCAPSSQPFFVKLPAIFIALLLRIPVVSVFLRKLSSDFVVLPHMPLGE